MAIGTAKTGTSSNVAGAGPATPGWPTDITNQETCVALVSARGNTTGLTEPVGWTMVGTAISNNVIRLGVFLHTFTTDDTAPSFSSVGGTPLGTYARIASWPGADPVMDAVPTTATGTTQTMSAPSIDTVSPDALVVNCFASEDDNRHVDAVGGGATTVFITDSTVGSDTSYSMAEEAMPSPGASGVNTRSQAATTSNWDWAALTLALRPFVSPQTGSIWVPGGGANATYAGTFTLGTEFYVTEPGYVLTHLHIYRPDTVCVGPWSAGLFTAPAGTGTLVSGSSVTISVQSTRGWQTAALPAPVPLTQNQRYRAAANFTSGFPAVNEYFTTGLGDVDVVNGPLTCPTMLNAVNDAQGSYTASSGSLIYPASGHGAAYQVDVTIAPASSGWFSFF